jgi:hypothetical protein
MDSKENSGSEKTKSPDNWGFLFEIFFSGTCVWTALQGFRGLRFQRSHFTDIGVNNSKDKINIHYQQVFLGLDFPGFYTGLVFYGSGSWFFLDWTLWFLSDLDFLVSLGLSDFSFALLTM